jgi:hypothetical protein
MKSRTFGIGIMVAAAFLGAADGFCLTSGTDVLIPAAARGPGRAESLWVSDLTILNLGSETSSVEGFWLRRNRVNSNPQSATFSVAPGAALVLDDVIFETFGRQTGYGAFRVVSDTEVYVAVRVYNLQESATFGQGFEGVPRVAAVQAGDFTDVASLRQDSRFRTNIVLIDASNSPAGSTVNLSLRDESGDEIASDIMNLGQLEPKLFPTTDLTNTPFTYATLHVEVVSGSVIVTGSKVDNDPNTGDPTTLEAWSPGTTVDGTYRFAIWDSEEYATGGNLVIENGVVEAMTGTYINYDKVDPAGTPECTLLFQFGVGFSPTDVEAFDSGVEFTDTYPDGGDLTWTITFSSDDHLGFAGTIETVGANFSGVDAGCNGSFPILDIDGGKEH